MTTALVEADQQDGPLFEQLLGARVAVDWPPQLWEAAVRVHIVAQLTGRPETHGWQRYMVLPAWGGVPLLVGCLGAFPGTAGDVELGYSVVDSFQRQGLATEAATALIDWLLRQPSVHSVSAQAYVSASASIKVMERCGMLPVGQGDMPETVRFRRWR